MVLQTQRLTKWASNPRACHYVWLAKQTQKFEACGGLEMVGWGYLGFQAQNVKKFNINFYRRHIRQTVPCSKIVWKASILISSDQFNYMWRSLNTVFIVCITIPMFLFISSAIFLCFSHSFFNRAFSHINFSFRSFPSLHFFCKIKLLSFNW